MSETIPAPTPMAPTAKMRNKAKANQKILNTRLNVRLGLLFLGA
jgi:hypothetical protein